MPEFRLNDHPTPKDYDSLSEFAKAYVKAMFFTNCDSGDEDEFKANNLGVSHLTRASLESIAADCASFESQNAETIAAVLAHGERDLSGIAHDFWFTRQGHGVGFWEGESRGYPGDTWKALDASARAHGEVWPSIYRGWIHYGG
jgi:hypothetical protein